MNLFINMRNQEEYQKKLQELKVGDSVTRMLSGLIPMPLKVTSINDNIITCGAWEFNRLTGAEIDDDLGWDGVSKTGSYLKL